jgi:hypothetical protein
MESARMGHLTIGYWPNSENCQAPGDRRRLIYWANARNHKIVLNSYQGCDAIVLTVKHHLGILKKTPQNIPKFFDAPDQYIEENSLIKDYGRAFIRGIENKSPLPLEKFSDQLKKCVSQDIHFICSSPEQERFYKLLRARVSSVLDFHEEFPNIPFRDRPLTSDKCKVMWEGNSSNLESLSNILNDMELNSDSKIALNVVTDEIKYKFANRYGAQPSIAFLESKKRTKALQITLIPWNVENVVKQSKHNHMILVPVNLSNGVTRMKPENRILIAWRLGIPAIAGFSQSHERLAQKVGSDFVAKGACWSPKIFEMYANVNLAEHQVSLGKNYLENFHNKEILLTKWDDIFCEVR